MIEWSGTHVSHRKTRTPAAEGYVTTQKNTLKTPKTSESTQNYPWRTPKKLVIPKKVNPESPKKARNTKQNPGVPPR